MTETIKYPCGCVETCVGEDKWILSKRCELHGGSNDRKEDWGSY